MRRASLVIGAVGVALAAVYLAEGRRYAWGTLADPGAGLYPFLVGALLVLGALGTGAEAWQRRAQADVEWPGGPGRRRMLAVLLVSLGYIVLLPALGHALASALLVLVVLHVMGLPFWPLRLALAVAIGLGSYYLFATVLGVPLPTGMWGS